MQTARHHHFAWSKPTLACLGVLGLLLFGCGASKAEQDAQATRIVFQAFASLTAAAPVPTGTMLPSPTPTASLTPSSTPAPPTTAPTPAPPTATRTPVPATATPAPFVIKGEKFQADILEDCKTDIAFTAGEGDSLKIQVKSGTLSIRGGKFTIWCYGAKHTWISKVSYGGHTFSSDADEPLQFIVDKDKGYVHVAGKGTVTLPDGTVVELTAAGSSAPSADTMPLTATRVPPTATRTLTPRPTITAAPTRTPEIPDGMGAFVVVNWYGQTMKVTINNKVYDVGASGGTTTIFLPPGHYTYSANWEDHGYYQGAVDIKLRGKFTMTFRE